MAKHSNKLQDVEAPAPGFQTIRVWFNLTAETVLGIAILVTGATKASGVLNTAILFLTPAFLLTTFFATVGGHEDSMRLMRCFWRTEKGSRRLATFLCLVLGGMLLYAIDLELLGHAMWITPLAWVVYRLLKRRLVRQ